MQPQHQTEVPDPSPGQFSHANVGSGIDSPAQPGLPLYIRPLPPRITPQDYAYLVDKGALSIPDEEFRKELLRTYADVVHPFMPVLDLDSFLVSVLSGTPHNPVSMLLFQTVMFSSIAFVDGSFLRSRGYTSRKSARKAFFGRVRLLYGLDCEPDRLALLQSLILMTYWYDSPEDEKDTWHWMGIALSLAQVLGFHRNPALLKLTSQERKLRSRIWWSCYMRDRQLALGLRRPPRIRDDFNDVPLLTLDDFDLDTPSQNLVNLVGPSSITDTDPTTRKVLAMLCIDLSKLCLCIGHVVYSQYTVLGNCPAGSENLLKVIVMPKPDKEEQALARCDAELDDWARLQDDSCKYGAAVPRSKEEVRAIAEDVIRLHQAILRMLHLATVTVLHRPHVFQAEAGAEENVRSRRASKNKVTQAAIAITKLAYDLRSRNQLRYLPTSSIPVFLSATLIHLLETRSSDEMTRNMSIGRFYQCLQALQHMQDMYASADYTVSFLNAFLRKTAIEIPGLTLGRPSDSGSNQGRYAPNCAPNASDLVVSARVDTAYPSPSSFRNLQASLESFPMNPLPSSDFMHHPSARWAQGQGNVVHDQQTDEIMADLPQVSMWSDIDSLFPALFSFDGEGNNIMSHYQQGSSSDWSFQF